LGEQLVQQIQLAGIRLASGEAEEGGADAGVGVGAEDHFGERAGRLGGEAAGGAAGQQDVRGGLFAKLGAHARVLPVGGEEHDLAAETFHVPAVRDEIAGDPVE
jgi:hypothetical protein